MMHALLVEPPLNILIIYWQITLIKFFDTSDTMCGYIYPVLGLGGMGDESGVLKVRTKAKCIRVRNIQPKTNWQ